MAKTELSGPAFFGIAGPFSAHNPHGKGKMMYEHEFLRYQVARDIVVAILGTSGTIVADSPTAKLGGTACEVLQDFLKPEKETGQ